MPFIDTHTHLYLDEFGNDCYSAVGRALSSGVTNMIMPNIDLTTIIPMKDLRRKFPENIHLAMGLHPTSVNYNWEKDMRSIEDEINEGHYIAIGEIGIDLYWDTQFKNEQMMAFEKQLEIASNKDLPIIIHCRNALDEVIDVMGKYHGLKGVFHSFGGSIEDVKKIRNRVGDFFFGINGIVTFKNSSLKNVLPEIGLERILLETDSPYLSPVPMRGKRCESAYIVYTANCIANTLGKPLSTIEDITSHSAQTLFSI